MAFLKKKTPHRYHFEIIPTRCEGVMAGPAQASVVCESGTKISYTEPSTLGADGKARFSSVMRMTSTIHKVENTLLPKEYKFKVQVIRESQQHGGIHFHHGANHQRRKTVARTKLNLAEFCTLSSTAAAQIVDVPLTPHGSLTLSIRAVWLQNWKKTKSSRSGGTSENESETDFSSIAGSDHSGGSLEARHAAVEGDNSSSSNPADLPMGGGVLPPPVKKTDRTSSADLSSLADYHLRINSMNARQAAAAAAIAASIVAGNRGSGSSDGRLRDALTARIVPKDSSAAAPVAVGATGLAGRGSNELLVASSAVAASANRLGRRRMFGGQSERSMIAPILEGEEASSGTAAATGSHDGSSESLEREKALSAEALRKHIAATSGDSFISSGGCSSRLAGGSAASNSSSPPRVRPASQRQRSGSSELPDSVMSSVCEDGRHGNMHKAPHGHLPQWMWPFAKDDAAAKEVTTDELMRQIGASGNDAAKLQQLCRGLLCERNDWRFKATQWEKTAAAMQEQARTAAAAAAAAAVGAGEAGSGQSTA
ncbi:hypothetical protein OEZ85_011224 [Tetradesmus obliquus]|uniref:C2 NT-type domain-containing protein n=1 Tax=Tetradesmus obliquus TaxID=3088 RepID=A0ABY8TUA8_TETOB|nr:hypothetical protein OEZ85_011224 [Tetradesmus obliquus]